MSIPPAEPWRDLPREVARVIAPELPRLREEIVAAIAREVPEYARPLEGGFGRAVRLGVDEALRQFADLVADPDRGRAQSREVYVALGRGEMGQGRGLDALQAAYRTGARVAWRRLADAGLRAGLPADVLCLLADAIFAYIDELAADSVEGYAQAQQAAAGERERRRRRLLGALLADPVDEAAVRAVANGLEWAVPREVAVLACRVEDLDAIARRLPAEGLAAVVDDLGCVVVPDPAGPGRAAAVAAACGSRASALGPVRPLREARASWERARGALSAIQAGALPSGFCAVDEHLGALALFEARDTLRDLAAHRLAPLAGLTPRARERMTDTLRAYLAQRGSAPAMAAALHVHPQTARYRLRQLRELFGEALDDPEARFELEAAVRAP